MSSTGAVNSVRVETPTTSPDETRAVGAALARLLRPGDVVLLVGDLGAGKTTLAQGVAAGLGVTEPVTSPTFVLVRPYPCAAPHSPANPTALRQLLHADLYRLEHTGELADLALGELVEDDAAALVEWGEVAGTDLQAGALVVRLSAPDDVEDHRQVVVELPSSRSADADALAPGLNNPSATNGDRS